MLSPQLLGQLGMTHELLTQLIESTPEPDCYRSFNPRLAPLAWYLGRSIYSEAYWLREVIQGDADLTTRVQEMFNSDSMPHQEQWSRLPPKDHLLNWALEIQDDNLKLLANPGLLPDHPLMQGDRLLHHLLQQHHRIYEQMLMVLTERQLHHGEHSHQVEAVLQRSTPTADAAGISQGHYRIGAKESGSAYDNELPAQMIELSSFRIARRPVSNSEFLGFMQDGGYQSQQLWSDTGWEWQQGNTQPHPNHWRQDRSENWFGIGLNGPADLPPDDPLTGINQHEAQAYASWAAAQGGELAGAVLQHEYQWEVAVRTQAIKEFGRVWEWCSNPFHPYTGHQPAEDGVLTTGEFHRNQITLRGSSIHTQSSLRRPSFRNHARAESRHRFSGTRLVFPPIK